MSSQVERTAASRRSLFPKSYTKKEPKEEKYVSFSPYARCLKLEPLNLTEKEKAELWWQKDDYEDFARIGKIISKAMLQGGSEVWFRSKCSLSGSDFEKNPNRPIVTTSRDDTMIPTSSSAASNSPLLFLNNNGESEKELQLEYESEFEYEFEYEYEYEYESQHDFGEMQDKWWHGFGHSRRGLEHIASSAEGRQRHLEAKSAIRSVLDEQKRQNLFLPKGYLDVDKFRSVYLKRTQWARLLARAAGDSDADAIRTGFDESKRKSREHYLNRLVCSGTSSLSSSSTTTTMTTTTTSSHQGGSHRSDAGITDVGLSSCDMPGFMTAMLSPTATATRSNARKKVDLDANTLSQLCFKFRNSKQQQKQKKQQVCAGSPPIDPKSARAKAKAKAKADEKKQHKKKHKQHKASMPSPESQEMTEEKKLQINDDDDTDGNCNNSNWSNSDNSDTGSTSSETSSSTEDPSTEDSSLSNLAKKAAGWGGEECTSQEDMSSVLIGMGISTKPNITIG